MLMILTAALLPVPGPAPAPAPRPDPRPQQGGLGGVGVEAGVGLLGVSRHVILPSEPLRAVRAAELPVTRVHHAVDIVDIIDIIDIMIGIMNSIIYLCRFKSFLVKNFLSH